MISATRARLLNRNTQIDNLLNQIEQEITLAAPTEFDVTYQFSDDIVPEVIEEVIRRLTKYFEYKVIVVGINKIFIDWK